MINIHLKSLLFFKNWLWKSGKFLENFKTFFHLKKKDSSPWIMAFDFLTSRSGVGWMRSARLHRKEASTFCSNIFFSVDDGQDTAEILKLFESSSKTSSSFSGGFKECSEHRARWSPSSGTHGEHHLKRAAFYEKLFLAKKLLLVALGEPLQAWVWPE